MMYSQPTEDPTLGRTGLVKSGIPSLTIKYPVPTHGMRQPAALTLGDRNGIHINQIGKGRISGLLQPVRL